MSGKILSLYCVIICQWEENDRRVALIGRGYMIAKLHITQEIDN